MNELQSKDRTPVIIAQEINVIRDQAGKIFLLSTLEIGQRLKEAKELVGHGNWGTWLETEVNYSQRTAQNLIKIYDEYGEKYLVNAQNPNTQAIANLSYTQALAMLKLNSEERENFLENNDVVTMTTKEIEDAIAEKKAVEEEKRLLTESIEKMVKENEDLRKQISISEDLQKKLDELKKKSIDPKEITTLEHQLSKSKAEVEKLKKNLAEAKMATTTVEVEKEVIPKDVQVEMEKMRTKLAMGEDVVRFKATFDIIASLFSELTGTLGKIKKSDEALYVKCKDATNKLLEKMAIKEGE